MQALLLFGISDRPPFTNKATSSPFHREGWDEDDCQSLNPPKGERISWTPKISTRTEAKTAKIDIVKITILPQNLYRKRSLPSKNAKFEVSIPPGIKRLQERTIIKNTDISSNYRLRGKKTAKGPFSPALNRSAKTPQKRLYLRIRKRLDSNYIAGIWHSNCVWPFNCFYVPRGTFRQNAAIAVFAKCQNKHPKSIFSKNRMNFFRSKTSTTPGFIPPDTSDGFALSW